VPAADDADHGQKWGIAARRVGLPEARHVRSVALDNFID
jgi:hypothetical protein